MMNTGAIIQDLIDWIDNHLDSRLDIDTVARRAGYSKWHLQRIFKEHTGQPLGEYIRAKKLQKSIERLAHSNEPILNVAIALGFDSQQSFNQLQAPVLARRPASGAGVSAALLRRHLVSDPHDRGGSVLTRPMFEFAAFADGIELPACDIVNGP
jgi:AraC family transcriptional activator of mar-sox-rob regulon